jgi:YD repeat-containing protein
MGACRQGVDWWVRNIGEGFKVGTLPKVVGDYRGYIQWLKHKLYIGIYTRDGLIVSQHNTSGRHERWTYDTRGNMLSHKISNGFPLSEKWTYDDEDNVLTHRMSNGLKEEYTYDHGLLVKYNDSNGFARRWVYNDKRQLVLHENMDHMISKYRYDAYGNRIGQDTYEYLSDDKPSVRHIWTYDEHGNKLTHTAWLRFQEDALEAEPYKEEWTYDSRGNITSHHTPMGLTEWTYDSNNNKTSMRSKDFWSKAQYDDVGNEIKIENANGLCEEYEYVRDGLGLYVMENHINTCIIPINKEVTK